MQRVEPTGGAARSARFVHGLLCALFLAVAAASALRAAAPAPLAPSGHGEPPHGDELYRIDAHAHPAAALPTPYAAAVLLQGLGVDGTAGARVASAAPGRDPADGQLRVRSTTPRRSAWPGDRRIAAGALIPFASCLPPPRLA